MKKTVEPRPLTPTLDFLKSLGHNPEYFIEDGEFNFRECARRVNNLSTFELSVYHKKVLKMSKNYWDEPGVRNMILDFAHNESLDLIDYENEKIKEYNRNMYSKIILTFVLIILFAILIAAILRVRSLII